MADTSPGKVQALRAMFTEKEGPVMGLMPVNGKLGTRPWKRSLSSLTEDNSHQQSKDNKPTPVHTAATRAILKTLQGTKNNINNSDASCDKSCKVPHKPTVGPKPVFMQQQCRTTSTPILNLTKNFLTTKPYENNVTRPRTKSEITDCRKDYDTIASFMFVTKPSDTVSDKCTSDISETPLPKLKISTSDCNPVSEANKQCTNSDSHCKPNLKLNSHLSLINSDNYICKSKCNFIQNVLPPKEKIGPPPLKPVKPPHMKLPEKYVKKSFLSSVGKKYTPQKPARPSVSPPPPVPVPQKPTYPCPPRPTTSPPIPPSCKSEDVNRTTSTSGDISNSQSKSLLEEIEELYEDTLLHEMIQRPVSLIPEYTAEEEESELYDDADEITRTIPDSMYPVKPKHPPPLPPNSYLDRIGNAITEELYQDAIEPITEEVYEEMPVDMQPEDHYSNNKKEFEKMRREAEKRMRKEVKEKERKEKEFDKVKKKFGLTGEELPIDAGLVKTDCRGGRSDLQVKKGDVVYILRIEGNPPGKWLVRNKKGKYGYVELTNIEVDPDSVKSVMTIRRTSVISTSEELYSEAYSEEEEGIYEMTY